MRPHKFWGISSYLSLAIATFGGRYARAVLMLIMTLYAFLIISAHKILNFRHFLQKRDIWTDRRTDGPTDGPKDQRTDRRMDTPSYRDARTYLKILWFLVVKKLRHMLMGMGPILSDQFYCSCYWCCCCSCCCWCFCHCCCCCCC